MRKVMRRWRFWNPHLSLFQTESPRIKRRLRPNDSILGEGIVYGY
jgi:hypothetical protein